MKPPTLSASPSRLGRALVACVAEHDWSAPPESLAALLVGVDAARLLEVARTHRVEGCVHASVRHLPALVPQAVRDAAAEQHQRRLRDHLAALTALHEVTTVLDASVSDWAVVKGPVLAAAVYGRPDLRSYSDVDLLVHPQELGVAVQALCDAGAELVDRNWPLIARRRLGELHLRMPGGVLVDLHWSLFNQRQLRTTFDAPTARLLARSRPVGLGGLTVRTLDALDTVVHLAVHAASSGGDRLVWLKDIEQALRRLEDDGVRPDALSDRAHEWRAALPVHGMVGRTAAVLGTVDPGWTSAVPVARPLAGGLTVVDRTYDAGRAADSRSLVRLVSRALRADARTTGVEVGRRGVLALRGRSSARRRALGHDPASRDSVLFDVRDDRARAAWFAELAAGRVA